VSLLSHGKARSLIRAHFALSISPREERKLRLHLTDCEECSGCYDRHLLLASLDPTAATAERRLAAGLGLTRRGGLQAFSLQLGFALTALAALVLLLLEKPAEFAARAGEPAAQVAEVFVYRVQPGQTGQAAANVTVGSSMRAADELAFAYVNSAGFSRLLIFGEDEHGHVYWYHPAWSDESANPRAIAIGSGSELRELPESIAHNLDGKRLRIRSIFSNAELSVRDVERLLAKERAGGGSLSTLLGDVKEVDQTLAVE
jgi:hypothetical protein